jgi:hypothetical protein
MIPKINGVAEFKEQFKIKEYEKLSSEDKNRFIRTALTTILKANPRGLTVSQVTQVLPFDIKTLHKHLEYLTAIREAYSIPIGKTNVYYPNGKLEHYTNFENVEIGARAYTFFGLVNFMGDYIYVQEKERDAHNTFKVTGGLMIEKDKLKDFIQSLLSFESRVVTRERELNG